MKTPLVLTILILIFFIFTSGCASNPCPCYPPSYYDPEPGAPDAAEDGGERMGEDRHAFEW